jgi:hypothetical protein
MLTMRPKRRAIMPSMVSRIRKIGVSILASTTLIQASRSTPRKSPGGGPPALLMRMSGCGAAASTARRPSSVVMSAATAVTRTPISRQRNRDGPPQPARCRTDDRCFASNSKIHDSFSSSNCSDEPRFSALGAVPCRFTAEAGDRLDVP